MFLQMSSNPKPGTAQSHGLHCAASSDQPDFDHGLLNELTGFSIKLTWLHGRELLRQGFGDTDITPHRFSMLEVISRNPGLRQARLAAALALSHPATSLAINFWEERDCVERRTISGDRRSFGIFTTRRGEETLQRLRGIVRNADSALTTELTGPEITELRRLLKKIHSRRAR
ncbi:MAG: MarR family winged helix-turn-helix transcriptional regulator [Alphaproteobacteria bacterium]|nr:MarR family winged helix-turn-helix transcriptional regulator [Alphaproteobacteria bacterium]MBU0792570.1 MarR family winged helix-turn-helix transcriptional regulator [Alphaproteobacteria bacterium]MBU0874779.1 MarR family winged helix-turn-helix transcriptional regulator [Alphaproteobacteria bacterium]MBU1768637.1 MarR family winged helix-turn-helix transcriptional regulator [Alphaproteobacteria bacterium]